jgi:type I site-specific restriction endonuclease
MSNELQDVFGPVISSYSRAQAIEDGILVDVSETAIRLR